MLIVYSKICRDIPMILDSSSTSCRLCFFVLLAPSVLILSCVLIPYWQNLVKHVDKDAHHNSDSILSLVRSEIESMATTLVPLNSTAPALSNVLQSSFTATNLSFSDIYNKVAPILYQTLLVSPYTSEISYSGLNGMFFSYGLIDDRNRLTLAVYANTSYGSDYTWYEQQTNPNSGKLLGNATRIPPGKINSAWFQASLSNTNAYPSIQDGWIHGQGLMLVNGAGINGTGVVSAGISVKRLTETFSAMNLVGGSLCLASEEGEVLLNGIEMGHLNVSSDSVTISEEDRARNYSCRYGEATSAMFGETTYAFYCASLNLLGKKLVYVLLIPDEATLAMGVIHSEGDVVLLLLVLLIVAATITTVSFVFLMAKTARREMQLSSALIKQMEATRRVESKCMNKSTAFAQASHDIRTALSGIMGLIDLSYDDVDRQSELHKNLTQMKRCAQDLLALLNSILDASKIEAGKMLLEEEEFDIAELIEDVVDLFYPVAMKKGVDVILDPHDGSVLKSSLVRGDRGKLKQILSNLLSNAVKFTGEGHIVVRAWAQKLNPFDAVVSIPPKRRQKMLSFLHIWRHKVDADILVSSTPRDVRNCADFLFEVSDTGCGIPKEKRKSVFENYIQVEETNQGQGGTGLGLGIVSSLVKLMGGDIKIVDKEIGEKGACFRFNVSLTMREPFIEHESETVDRAAEQSFSHWRLGSAVRSLTRALSIHSPSPRHTSSPNSEGSLVILLMRKDERCSVTRRFLRRLGIEVFVANQVEDLDLVSRKMQPRLKNSRSFHSLSGFSDISLRIDSFKRSGSNKCFPGGPKDSPLRVMEGTDQISPVHMRTSRKHQTGFMLLVVDTTMGPFLELHKTVTEFREGIPRLCRIIWLDKPMSRTVDRKLFTEGSSDPINLVLLKPLHGSCLFETIKLLPEFAFPTDRMPFMRAAESPAKKASQTISQEIANVDGAKPLDGKKVLVVDDNAINRRIAEKYLKKLGARVYLREDGSDALELVRDGLFEQMNRRSSTMLPYDYILMDCQMPGLDGYETTARIREEEKRYGVRIPIIALTAHDSGPEVRKIFEVGMDYHLMRPLSEDRLLEAIASIRST